MQPFALRISASITIRRLICSDKSGMTVFLLLILQLAQISQSQSDWRVVETTKFDWSKSASSQTFILEERHEKEFRLTIQTPGRTDFILPVPNGFVVLRDDLVMKQLAADNLLSSSYLYLSPRLRDRLGRPMLVVVGEALASGPGSLAIIRLDRKGFPRIVFSSEEFELTATEDLDADGRSEIVGLHCLSQAMTEELSTYDPVSVYRLNRRTDKAVFSLALTKAYNLKHYAWAGPECSEKTLTIWCAGENKPLVMNAQRAWQFIERGGCGKH